MKKSKLSLGLIAGLLSVSGLAGCENNIKSSKNGVLFSYYINGVTDPVEVKADDVLGDYFNDSTKYQAIFDTVYSVIVRNFFVADHDTINYHGTPVTLGLSQMKKINADAAQKKKDDIDTIKTNAKTNSTSYKKERDKFLEEKGVKTLDELEEKYREELQKETFEKNFYTYYIEEIKAGGESSITYKDSSNNNQPMWTGYFKQEVPYHVSHILIKLDDETGTNYANGTIGASDAKDLADVVAALGKPQGSSEYYDSFETIAKQYSEDDGSRENKGDLGIMDYSTDYVNEFKLGVYAYENFYSTATLAESRAKDSVVDLVSDTTPESIYSRYSSAVEESFDSATIPTIHKSVFENLAKEAEHDLDKNDDEVLEGSSLIKPRNIIYNKYLNRHAVAFITGDQTDALPTTGLKKSVGYWKYETGKLSTLKDALDNTIPVLSVNVDGEWTPILCVRAGSGYQGIHFIVVNRSAFELGGNETHPVTQSDYYTTFNPEQDYYPTVPAGRKTYVNFSSDLYEKTNKRAVELQKRFKGETPEGSSVDYTFSKDKLAKYIFKKFMQQEAIRIADEDLQNALFNWIDSAIDKSVEDRSEAWTKKWNEYIDVILRQNSERKRLVPQIVAKLFDFGNDASTTKVLNDAINYDAKKTDPEYVPMWEELKTSGFVKDYDADDDIDDDDVKHFWENTKLSDSFKKKGGLCNDGKDY